MSQADFVTSCELAALAGVDRRTLIRWEKSGVLPVGSKVRGASGRGWRKVYPRTVVAVALELKHRFDKPAFHCEECQRKDAELALYRAMFD